MRLDRVPSSDIVNELVRIVGEAQTMEILKVNPTRLKSLVAQRGCLTRVQLEHITAQTGKAWVRWGIDGGARHAKTAKARAFVASANALWDEIEGKSKTRSIPSSPRRRKLAGLRQAV